MVSLLPFRPLLRHRQQQLNQRSTSHPFAPSAVFVSVQTSLKLSLLSSGHRHKTEGRILPGCCSHPTQSTRRPFRVTYHGHATGGASWRGRRTGGGGAKVNNKNVEWRVQLIGKYGYAGKRIENEAEATQGLSAAARGAFRSEGVECVQEDVVEEMNHEAVLAEGDVKILATYLTRYNYVRVLEVSRTADSVLAGARVLLLDKPGNVHSIYQKYKVLTEAYYDVLATLPAVIPEGPIGILGLGAGTAARLIHHFWQEIDIHGWELDPGVVQAARKFFYLEELEWKDSNDIAKQKSANDSDSPRQRHRRRNLDDKYGFWADESDEVKLGLFQGLNRREDHNTGRLRVHVGDALTDPSVGVEGGFAGLIVDLFAEGAVLPELQEVETWRRLRAKLRPRGRIMVNCGGSCVEPAAKKDGGERKDGAITMRATVAAIAEAFPGELWVIDLRDHGDNSIAMTGPPPDLALWSATLPECLRRGVDGWRSY